MKELIKNIVGNTFSVFDYPIVVNSYGRSGSTILTRSLMKGGVKPQINPFNKIASGSIHRSAWDLKADDLEPGYIYKTHDYPPVNVPHNQVRMLYTFADPVDVVASLLRIFKTKGEGWMQDHYQHLKAPYGDFSNIIHEDQLGLEKHLDAWLKETRFPVAFIRYETMWEHQDDISNFLGFAVKLPSYRERKAADFDGEDVLKTLEETYRSLREKVNSLSGFFIINES